MEQQLSYANAQNFGLVDQIVQLYASDSQEERTQIEETLKAQCKSTIYQPPSCYAWWPKRSEIANMQPNSTFNFWLNLDSVLTAFHAVEADLPAHVANLVALLTVDLDGDSKTSHSKSNSAFPV